MNNKYSVILGNLGNTCDRFVPSGYKQTLPKKEMIRQAAETPGIKGLELIGGHDISMENISVMNGWLKEAGLSCVSIIPDLFSRREWGEGTLSAKSRATRERAAEELRSTCQVARHIGCPLINLWLGQDGYDYPLTADFRKQREWLVGGIKTIAQEFPDLKFALEYKMKEPRTHSFQARAADTLLMAVESGLENVGVCLDVGHAFAASENASESAVLLAKYDKLFHMHFNDNYRSWNDDMIVGSVHVVEYFELLFWLKEIGYEGWYSMDQYPYREDGKLAVQESVAFLQGVERVLTAASITQIRQLIASGEAVQSTRWMREVLFARENQP